MYIYTIKTSPIPHIKKSPIPHFTANRGSFVWKWRNMNQNFPAYRGSPFIETPLIEVALYWQLNRSWNLIGQNYVCRGTLIVVFFDTQFTHLIRPIKLESCILRKLCNLIDHGQHNRKVWKYAYGKLQNIHSVDL